jgi:ubiquinone/menaquinone biosynthesis C-methylase UbiE
MKTNKLDPTEITINTYNKISQQYLDVFGDYWKEDKEYIDKFLSYLPDKSLILDAACGPGTVSKYFLDKGYSVTGIDLSEEMIKLAKKINAQGEFKVMDLRKLEFPENTFDGIFCSFGLPYIPKSDVKKTLEGIHKVLKDKGYLFLSLLEGEKEKFVKDLIEPSERVFVNFFHFNEIIQCVEDALFDIVFKKIYRLSQPVESDNKIIFDKEIFIIARAGQN